jgi:hypothetical protein
MDHERSAPLLAHGVQVLAELNSFRFRFRVVTSSYMYLCFLGLYRVQMGDQHLDNQKNTSNSPIYTEDQQQ